MIGVFGANGFIGQHVTRSLVDTGHDVVAVARSFKNTAPGAASARMVEADFRDPDAMKSALVGVQTVVQLISSSTPAMGNSRITGDIQENVIPHVSFLQQCVRAGVRRYVFLSSGGTVYGPVSGADPIPETAPTSPICSHGITKLMVEKLIAMHGHIDQLDYMILRVSNPFGPRQILKNGQGLIPALLAQYESELPVKIFGDGSASRDYIYVDDLVESIQAAIELEGHRQVTLNVGTGIGRSILEVVRAIEEVAGIKFDIQYVPARKSDVHSISLDIERARSILDWMPRTSFRDGLTMTLGQRAAAFERQAVSE